MAEHESSLKFCEWHFLLCFPYYSWTERKKEKVGWETSASNSWSYNASRWIWEGCFFYVYWPQIFWYGLLENLMQPWHLFSYFTRLSITHIRKPVLKEEVHQILMHKLCLPPFFWESSSSWMFYLCLLQFSFPFVLIYACFKFFYSFLQVSNKRIDGSWLRVLLN